MGDDTGEERQRRQPADIKRKHLGNKGCPDIGTQHDRQRHGGDNTVMGEGADHQPRCCAAGQL